MHNRQEWELRGQEVVAEMIAKYKDVDVEQQQQKQDSPLTIIHV